MKKIHVLLIALFITSLAHAQYNRDIKVETLLQSDTTSIGQKISYPQFKDSQVTISKVTIPPGGSTGWHKHDIPVFAYIIKGTLTVDVENTGTRSFSANASFAEVLHAFHNGRNDGSEDVVLIAVYLGGEGKELSVRK